MKNISIKTEDFEGPLDLFIHLIENKKIDISKIIISEIIDEYLQIIENEKEQRLKIKVEFLAMASEILEIKAYSILSEEKKEEKEKNLEKRIFEYKIIKEIAEEFSKREVEYNVPYKISGNKTRNFDNIFYSIEELNLELLKNIFNDIIKDNNKKNESIKIEFFDNYTTENALFDIENEFKNNNEIKFSSLLKGNFSKIRIVSFFLAILDLFKSGRIDIYKIDEEFYIRREKND